MGETITHETVRNQTHGPVTALARRVHHVLTNGGTADNLLCDFIDDNGKWFSVTSTQMRNVVRASVRALELDKNGIDTDLVGVHGHVAWCGEPLAPNFTDVTQQTSNFFSEEFFFFELNKIN